MQTVDHQTWVKLARFNKRVAWVTVVAIMMGMMSMLFASAYQEVRVYHNGTCQTLGAYDGDPRHIMEDAGIDPATEEYEMEQTQQGLVLRVSPLFRHTLTVDGAVTHFEKRTDTVASMLNDFGVVLGEYDTVTPALDTIVNDNTNIVVQRVRYATRTAQEAVNPGVTYEETMTLPLGTEKLKYQGKSGSEQVTYREKIVDGKVVSSERLYATLLQPSLDRVVYQGIGDPDDFAPMVTTDKNINNKVVSPLLMDSAVDVDKNGRPLNFKKRINGLATAYYEGPNGITATGVPSQLGHIAVDPNEIPYGTKMFIRTVDGSYIYGVAVASDTGGFVSGPVDVDLYFNSEEACVRFGVRDVEIYVL